MSIYLHMVTACDRWIDRQHHLCLSRALVCVSTTTSIKLHFIIP